jgi:hypothetical protein
MRISLSLHQLRVRAMRARNHLTGRWGHRLVVLFDQLHTAQSDHMCCTPIARQFDDNF